MESKEVIDYPILWQEFPLPAIERSGFSFGRLLWRSTRGYSLSSRPRTRHGRLLMCLISRFMARKDVALFMQQGRPSILRITVTTEHGTLSPPSHTTRYFRDNTAMAIMFYILGGVVLHRKNPTHRRVMQFVEVTVRRVSGWNNSIKIELLYAPQGNNVEERFTKEQAEALRACSV